MPRIIFAALATIHAMCALSVLPLLPAAAAVLVVTAGLCAVRAVRD